MTIYCQIYQTCILRSLAKVNIHKLKDNSNKHKTYKRIILSLHLLFLKCYYIYLFLTSFPKYPLGKNPFQ